MLSLTVCRILYDLGDKYQLTIYRVREIIPNTEINNKKKHFKNILFFQKIKQFLLKSKKKCLCTTKKKSIGRAYRY